MNTYFLLPSRYNEQRHTLEKSVKSGSWRHGNLHLRWDHESGVMEVGCEQIGSMGGSGTTIWVKIDEQTAYDFSEVLNGAASEI